MSMVGDGGFRTASGAVPFALSAYRQYYVGMSFGPRDKHPSSPWHEHVRDECPMVRVELDAWRGSVSRESLGEQATCVISALPVVCTEIASSWTTRPWISIADQLYHCLCLIACLPACLC